MNRAVFIFTFILKFSTISKLDLAFITFAFLGFIGAAIAKTDLTNIAEMFTSPPFLLGFGFGFSQDIAINLNSLRDGEYFALLFTRPITRVSYVLTKAVVVSLGIQALSWLMLGLLLVAQVLVRSEHIIFINGWQALSLLTNSFGFGCLIVLLRTLPAKIGVRAFFLVLSVALVQSTMDFTMKFDSTSASMLYAWEGLFTFFQNFLYPVLDFDAIVSTNTFSWVPFVDYVSNCLLYLVVAAFILNRREFSYAQG
jgi:hypothetical protein